MARARTDRGYAVHWMARPPREVIDLLPGENEHTVAVHAMMTGAAEFRTRALVVTRPDGEVAGITTLGRVCLDRWLAAPWFFDDGVAETVGRAIDVSRASAIIGPERFVRALEPYVDRKSFGRSYPFFAVRAKEVSEFGARYNKGGAAVLQPVPGPAGLQLPPPDPRVRLATRADLDSLMALIGDVGFDFLPTRRRARRYLAALVDRGRVLAADIDGRAVGLIWAEFRSPRWELWGGLRVDIKALRYGVSWPLAFEATRASEQSGRTFCCMIGPRNTMKRLSYFNSHPDIDKWFVMTLRPRKWFKGHNRLRLAVERLEGARENALTP